jgi:arginyl-tRNA synthetase
LASILAKAGDDGTSDLDSVDFSLLADAERVLLSMLEFGPTVDRASLQNEPSIITGLMITIAGEIHSYLRDHNVIRAEPDLKRARLALVAAGRKLLGRGLGLLGVAAVDQM